MAKKKKEQSGSKKAEQKKKNQQIEDRTFGLKNKNKSKKVQSYVKSVTNSVNNSGDRKQRAEEERRKRAKAEQKLRKQQMKDEANALFNEGESEQLVSPRPALSFLAVALTIIWFYFFTSISKHWEHSKKGRRISKRERPRPREEMQTTMQRRKEPPEQ